MNIPKADAWVLRGGKTLCPAPFCLVGIVNVTPDSFSDGGRFAQTETAVAHGLDLLAGGAHMLDLGAESTRPFAPSVSAKDEQARLLPVLRDILRAVHQRYPEMTLSVDTYKASTAAAALTAGADAINDVSACAFDPELQDVLAQYKPGYVLMHSQGRPADMQRAPSYEGDVVATILRFFEQKMSMLIQAGLPEDRIVLDPGIGFGKNQDHNLAILQGIERFRALGRPLYVGLSRKSLFKDLLQLPLEQRDEATHIAVALLGARNVRYHRVHDVAGCARALRLTAAMARPAPDCANRCQSRQEQSANQSTAPCEAKDTSGRVLPA